MSRLLVKICGLSTPETVAVAVEAGADLIGFNFFPKSPRYVTPERAAELTVDVPTSVGLLVDPDDALVERVHATLAPSILQLHGQEPPERVAALRKTYGPVMKVLGVSHKDDLAQVPAYHAVADYLLLDAKPPKGAAYPGGHGQPFDWSILKALAPTVPFFLAGGLVPENVGEAIRIVRGMGLNLIGVDVASGVESAPGVKDEAKIRAFVAAARAAE